MASPKKIRVSKSTKAGITFPAGRIQRQLREGNYANRIGTGAAVYLGGVLEYLSAEILELAGNVAGQHSTTRIIPRHIKKAIGNDAELNELLKGVEISEGGVISNVHPLLLPKIKKRKSKGKNEALSNIEASKENETVSENDADLNELLDGVHISDGVIPNTDLILAAGSQKINAEKVLRENVASSENRDFSENEATSENKDLGSIEASRENETVSEASIENDADLNELLDGVHISESGVIPTIDPILAAGSKKIKTEKTLSENGVSRENKSLSENEASRENETVNKNDSDLYELLDGVDMSDSVDSGVDMSIPNIHLLSAPGSQKIKQKKPEGENEVLTENSTLSEDETSYENKDLSDNEVSRENETVSENEADLNELIDGLHISEDGVIPLLEAGSQKTKTKKTEGKNDALNENEALGENQALSENKDLSKDAREIEISRDNETLSKNDVDLNELLDGVAVSDSGVDMSMPNIHPLLAAQSQKNNRRKSECKDDTLNENGTLCENEASSKNEDLSDNEDARENETVSQNETLRENETESENDPVSDDVNLSRNTTLFFMLYYVLQ